MTPSNWRGLIDRARRAAQFGTPGEETPEEEKKKIKLTPWPHDATRHSFGTYEMARTKDIGHVSEVMGNSPAIVQRHYKAAGPFELGGQYFAISPEEGAKIIPLAATAA